MKKKRGYKFMLIIYCFLMVIGTAVGYSIYTINDKNIVNISGALTPDASRNLNKVIFKDAASNIIDTVYVPNGKKIDSSNTPLMGTKRIKWHENSASGAVKLDLCSKNTIYHTFTPTSKDTTLVAVEDTTKDKVSDALINNNDTNGNNTTISGNNVTMVEKTGADKKYVCNDITIGGSLDGVNVNATYKSKQNTDEITNDLNTVVNQANIDETIGLEDPAAPKTMYRPNANPNGLNYCVSRITLDSDLIITNSTLNIGAMVGFFGNTSDWSQRNMQGFIIGNYSEVDLNGHNLIVGQGGNLNAYGSITNSVPGTGKVIVEKGGSMKATCVFEEMNLERSLPVQYCYGGELLTYYKMPYLNCDVRIMQGGSLTATLKIDVGGGNKNFIDTELLLIGSSNNAIYQVSEKAGTKGYVDRNSSFDENIYNMAVDSKKQNNFLNAKNNLIHQTISYKFYNCNIIINSNVISLSYAGIMNIKIDLSKNGYIIPHYFSYYLYNSNVSIPMNLTFFPGSYLYADEKSNINLTSSNFFDIKLPSILGISLGLHNSYAQTVGSLNFVMEKYDFNDALNSTLGWVDDSQGNHASSGGGHMLIRKNSDMVIDYINKNKPTHADILGTITFENIIGYNSNSLHHQIGGKINIKNVGEFKKTVASRNDVDLFSSSGNIGPCNANGSTLSEEKVNLTEFFVAPLVSNGNVLMDLNNQGKVRDNYLTDVVTYDKRTGLVTYYNKQTKSTEYYAFLHTLNNSVWNGDISHAKKSYYKKKDYPNNKDSYYGKFFKVNVNTAGNYIDTSGVSNIQTTPSSGVYTYIFFRGAFMPYEVNSNIVHMDKFRAASSDLNVNGAPIGLNRTVEFSYDDGYGYKVWRIVK